MTARPVLQILHHSEDLLVVNKPSGLIVHRGWGHDRVTVISLLRQQQPEISGLHPLGRLDRGASGVLLLALNPVAARQLSEAQARGEIRRRYLALVRGQPPQNGTIDHPIPRRPGGPRVPAVSDFRLLQSCATEPRSTSLVLVSPRSGRLHQVRRHLKHLSCPLIGDANYGKGAINRAMAERYGLRRLALHAHAVCLADGDQRLEVRAPLPEDMTTPLERMGFVPDPDFTPEPPLTE